MDEDRKSFTKGYIKKSALVLLSFFLIWVVSKCVDVQYFLHFLFGFSNLFVLNVDAYPYSNPPIFFSIGEALAAIAIIFTVYQFKKESWEIALEVRPYIQFTVVGLILIGFVAIILSSIVESFWQPSNIFKLSIFWQVLAALLIIIAILFLFLKTNNKNLFNERTKNHFIGSLLRRVLSRSPKQMDLVVNVLVANLKAILKEISSTPRRGNDISEFTKSAHFVLTQIVSNPTFAHHIVTTRADFFQLFLHHVREEHLYRDNSIGITFNSLVKASFTNRDSYFYNELKHSGPGIYYKPFLNDIFFDQDIFLNLRPFEQISFDIGEVIDPDKLGLFLTTLEIALEGYWKKPPSMDFQYPHYNKAFALLEDALNCVIHQAQYNNSKDDWHVTSKLNQIMFFAGSRFQSLYNDALENKKVLQHDLDALVDEKACGIYPQTITARYAELLFKLLCVLSRYPKKEDVRYYALFMVDHILIFNKPEFTNIRAVLLRYIWKKINGSGTSNINGYYPAILPVFLSLIGMWADSMTQEEKALYNKTVDFLNSELKPKILADTKMANDVLMEEVLLPPEIKFNREKGLFEWQMRGSVQEMVIRE